MRRVRQIHVWLGVFFAPAILFFAVSGAVMTLGLHKNRSGSDAIPVFARMAEIHRKQDAFPQAAGAAKSASEQSHGEKAQVEKTQGDKDGGDKAVTGSRSRTAFRVFVVVMAFGLVMTTLLGLVMAFANKGDGRKLVCALLLGLVLPVVILLV